MVSSAEIHRSLGHPVIDIDGHMAEHLPTLAPYLEDEGLSLDHPSLRRLLDSGLPSGRYRAEELVPS